MAILVSDAAAEESLQAYTSPLSLQAKALDDISKKVLDGAVVSDGNNPFTFLTEFASNMTADIVTKACECFNNLYPENAQTATELYKHLSDFGYIGLYATPASTTVELVFNRNFIIDNAVKVDPEQTGLNYDPTGKSGTFSQIIIPAYSKFTIGDYIFGLMYPIKILVRKAIVNNVLDYANSTITVVWDNSSENPLMPLESHILNHRDYEQDGVTLTAIEIPIYQFEVENHVENAIASTGFSKRYDFKDRFYAVRIFHFKNGRWNELEQTFSDTNYDVDIPTAIVKVLQDIGKVEIVIPHIYFNSEDRVVRLGNRILVKLYTTKGEINVDLSEYQLDQFTASFLLTDTNLVEDDTYSNMLKRIPTVFVIPLTKRIASGTNGITFQQLKNRVKYNNSYTVKITPSDLENYFNTSGYKFTRELDNITDRVYCAHKVLTDKTGTPVASGEGTIIISTSIVDSDEYAGTISKFDDQTFTINPSALYKYNETDDTFILLKDQEKSALLSSDLAEKVYNFNNNLYTYSPFHIVVSNAKSNPISGVFDMYNPSLRSIMFAWENNATTAEISIYNTDIKPYVEDDKLLGYKLRVSIFKTTNLDDIKVADDKNNIKVVLTTETTNGLLAHMYGEYEGIDDDGKEVFVFNITSNFRMTKDGDIDLTSFDHELGVSEEVFVPSVAHSYTISFFVLDEKLEEAVGAVSKANSANFRIPRNLDSYTMLCRQVFTLKLGESFPLLQSNITIATTDAIFKAFPTAQFATYTSDIYARWSLSDYDEESDEEKKKEILKKLGTLKYVNNELVVKHKAGDVIVSSPYGLPYGPVITISIENNNITDSLELDDVTFVSNQDNIWTSIPGSVYLESSDYPEFTGVYVKVEDDSSVSWVYEDRETKEVFDASVIPAEFISDRIFSNSSSGIHVPDLTGYSFYSSNSDRVLDKIQREKQAAIRDGREYNLSKEISTSAKGKNRKWFLLTDPIIINPGENSGTNSGVNIINAPATTDAEFNFETYTGYVLEYNAVSYEDLGGEDNPDATNAGINKRWTVNYYSLHEQSDDDPIEERGIIYPDVTTVVPDVMLSDLDNESKEILRSDPYTNEILPITYTMCYARIEDSDDGEHFVIVPNINDSNATDTLYMVVFKDSVNDPVFFAVCRRGSNRVSANMNPWDLRWSAVDSEKKAPCVSLLKYGTDTDTIYTLESKNALSFMISQADRIGQQGLTELYRYYDFDTNRITSLLEKRYSDIPLFIIVKGKDNTNQLDVNMNLYRQTRVGYTDATGALYYLDYSAFIYDYEKDGLTAQQVGFIFNRWYNYRTLYAYESERHTEILNDFTNEFGQGLINIATIKKIVSDEQPCFYFPYRKIVTCGSDTVEPLEALQAYSANDSSNHGFVSLIKKNGEVCYCNLLTGFDISPDDSDPYDDTSTNLSASWVDKWPWEYTTPWICVHTYTNEEDPYNPSPAIEGDATGKERDDISITYNSSLSGTKILHGTSDLILDEEGNPIIDENGDREILYGINTIQCDYKLRLSEDAEYIDYLDSIRDLIRSYLYELKAITPSLLARTKLYFTPIRTFGSSEFKGSSSETTVRPVQCSIELGLHIESYVHNSVTRKRIIRDEVVEYILKDIKDGTINLSVLAKTLMKELSDDIVFVDVLGINGDKTLQTLIPAREDCYPQLKQILVLHDDGTIHADHDLVLDWYVIN